MPSATAKPFRSEAAVAALIFAAATVGCWSYMKTFGVVTGPEHNVADMLAPAVFYASGHGFSTTSPLPEGVQDFLNHKTSRLETPIPSGLSVQPARGLFYQDRFYLIYAVGIVWRLFGISWANVAILSALFFGATAAIVYGIFRLAMRRTIALAGMAAAMSSPSMLVEIPSIRDFTKAPFILAALFLCGCLIMRPVSRKRFLALALAMGLVIGAGMGFRQDAVVCLPLALFFLLFLARGTPPEEQKTDPAGPIDPADCPPRGAQRLPLKIRLAGASLALAAFVVPAWPAISITSETGGYNAFYLTQGFSLPCLLSADLERASYTPLCSNADYLVHAFIYTYAKTHLAYYQSLPGLRLALLLSAFGEFQATPATPAFDITPKTLLTLNESLEIWTPPAEKAARRYVYELASTFPGDVVARWYAATLRIVRNLSNDTFTGNFDAFVQAAAKIHAPIAGHLYRFGLFYAAAAILIMAGRDMRIAFGVLFLLIYLCGYPSLEFQNRHAFHLNFASFWFPGFVLDNTIRAVHLQRSKRFRLGGMLRAGMRAGLFVVAAAILLCLPLYAARTWQERYIVKLIERYRMAELDPIPSTVRPYSGGGKIYCPSRFPSFEHIPPVKLWNLLASAGLPAKRAPDILVEYVAVDFESMGEDPNVLFKYEDPAAGCDTWESYPLSRKPNPGTFRLFFPVFRFTENFPFYDTAPLPTFRGIVFPDNVRVKGFYRVRNKEDFPLLMNVWMPSDLSFFRTYQRVKLLPNR